MEERPVETTLYSLADAPPERSDRRDSDRQLTLFRVGLLVIDGRRELCLIKNISAGGMLIRAYCAIEPGTRVAIELKCGEPVDGTVRWIDGDSIGVAFDQPIDVVGLLATSMEGPRPRMPRVQVDCIAWIREGAITHRVQALDVSQGGIKVSSNRDLPAGADVMVTLPGLPPVAGVVRWRDSGNYGVTFNKVVPLPLLVGWLAEQRQRLRSAG